MFAEIRIRQPRARHAVGVHVHAGLVARLVARLDDIVVVRGVRLHEHRGRPAGGHGHRHRGARCVARNQSPRQSRGCARASRARAAGGRGRAGHRARARVRRACPRRHRHPTPVPPPVGAALASLTRAPHRRHAMPTWRWCVGNLVRSQPPSVAIRREPLQIFLIFRTRSPRAIAARTVCPVRRHPFFYHRWHDVLFAKTRPPATCGEFCREKQP